MASMKDRLFAPLNCEKRWITFSCNGEFSSIAVANRKWDVAQLANRSAPADTTRTVMTVIENELWEVLFRQTMVILCSSL